MARAGLLLLVAAAVLAAFVLVRDGWHERELALASRNATLAREVDALAKSSRWHEARLAAAGKQSAELDARLTASAGVLRRAEERLAAAVDAQRHTQERLAEMSLARDRAEAERDQMARTLEQTQARAEQALGATSDAVVQAQDELDALRLQLQQSRAALEQSEALVRRQRQHNETQQQRLAVVEGELHDAQALAEDRGAELATQRAEADTASAAEVERLNIALGDVMRERDAALKDWQGLQAWVDTQSAVVAVLEERLATEQAARLAAEESLVARDNKLLEQVRVLEHGIGVSTRSLQRLDVENADMARELSDLQQRLAEAADSLQRLEARNRGVTSENADLQQRLASADSDRAGLVAALVAVEAERDTLREALADAAGERDRLSARLEALADSRSTLQERLAATAGELDAARSRAAGLTAGYEQLLARSAQLSSLSDSQRAEIDHARRALEAAQQAVARLSGARGIYTVQQGDSLSGIARFFYRNGNLWPKVMRANAHLIGSDPDLIFAGMVLIVPH